MKQIILISFILTCLLAFGGNAEEQIDQEQLVEEFQDAFGEEVSSGDESSEVEDANEKEGEVGDFWRTRPSRRTCGVCRCRDCPCQLKRLECKYSRLQFAPNCRAVICDRIRRRQLASLKLRIDLIKCGKDTACKQGVNNAYKEGQEPSKKVRRPPSSIWFKNRLRKCGVSCRCVNCPCRVRFLECKLYNLKRRGMCFSRRCPIIRKQRIAALEAQIAAAKGEKKSAPTASKSAPSTSVSDEWGQDQAPPQEYLLFQQDNNNDLLQPSGCVTCGHIECANGEIKLPQTCFRCSRCLKASPPTGPHCPALRCPMVHCEVPHIPKDKQGCPMCPQCTPIALKDESETVVPSQPFTTPKEKTGVRPVAPVIQHDEATKHQQYVNFEPDN